MEERNIFNPYNLNNFPPNISLPPSISQPPVFVPSPLDFYTNQYYYYRYLNEYLDYSMKSAEYEKKFGALGTNGTNHNLKG